MTVADRGRVRAESREHGSDWLFLLGTGVAVVLALGAALYAYQRSGGEFVDGLDEQIGELIAVRARSNASAGMTGDALALFEDALATPFMDEEQRLHCIHDYAALLIDEGQYQTALTWIEAGATDHPDDTKLAFMRFNAAHGFGRTEEAIAAAERWYAIGAGANDVNTMRDARFGQGIAYRDSEQFEKAVEAFVAAHDLKPGADTALRIGRLYTQLGRSERAREFLEYAVAEGGAGAERAETLLKKLRD